VSALSRANKSRHGREVGAIIYACRAGEAKVSDHLDRQRSAVRHQNEKSRT
jgi:hypothetical protein